MFEQLCSYELFSVDWAFQSSLKHRKTSLDSGCYFITKVSLCTQATLINLATIDEVLCTQSGPVTDSAASSSAAGLTQFDNSHGRLLSWGWAVCLGERGASYPWCLSASPGEETFYFLLILKVIFPHIFPLLPKRGWKQQLSCVLFQKWEWLFRVLRLVLDLSM